MQNFGPSRIFLPQKSKITLEISKSDVHKKWRGLISNLICRARWCRYQNQWRSTVPNRRLINKLVNCSYDVNFPYQLLQKFAGSKNRNNHPFHFKFSNFSRSELSVVFQETFTSFLNFLSVINSFILFKSLLKTLKVPFLDLIFILLKCKFLTILHHYFRWKELDQGKAYWVRSMIYWECTALADSAMLIR